MERIQGHTSSTKKTKKNPISLAFYISPYVRSLTSADYCVNRLTQNTTVSAAGISHKRVPTGASYLAPIKPPGMQLKPGKQTDSKLCLYHPAKESKSQHTVLSIYTPIVTTMKSNALETYQLSAD